jgi:hypothetical protein
MIKIKRLNENNNDDSCRLLNDYEYVEFLSKGLSIEVPDRITKNLLIQMDKIYDFIKKTKKIEHRVILVENQNVFFTDIEIKTDKLVFNVLPLEDYYYYINVQIKNRTEVFICDDNDGISLLGDRVIELFKLKK